MADIEGAAVLRVAILVGNNYPDLLKRSDSYMGEGEIQDVVWL